MQLHILRSNFVTKLGFIGSKQRSCHDSPIVIGRQQRPESNIVSLNEQAEVYIVVGQSGLMIRKWLHSFLCRFIARNDARCAVTMTGKS